MSAFLFPRRGYLGVLAAAFWAAPWLAAQAQPLTFERAQALAEQSAPENLARQAQVASAQQAVEPADALPDPKLILAACRTFPLAGRIAHRSWNLTV